MAMFTVYSKPARAEGGWTLVRRFAERTAAEREARARSEIGHDAIVNDPSGAQVYEVRGIPGRADEVRPVGVRLNRPEKMLAFGIATAMLQVDPAKFVHDMLVELAEDTDDVFVACAAMRDAREHDRVTAALRVLRERRRVRVERREGCTCNAPATPTPRQHAPRCPVHVRWDGSTTEPRHEVQGLVGGRWAWEHVACTREGATYGTREAAINAMAALVATNGWDPSRLRTVEVSS